MSEEEKKAMDEDEIKFRAYLLVLNSEFPTHRKTEAMEELLKINNKQQKEIKKLTRLNSAYKTNYDSKVLKEERKNKKILEGYISKEKISNKIKEIENVETDKITREEYNRIEFAIETLQELLEE